MHGHDQVRPLFPKSSSDTLLASCNPLVLLLSSLQSGNQWRCLVYWLSLSGICFRWYDCQDMVSRQCIDCICLSHVLSLTLACRVSPSKFSVNIQTLSFASASTLQAALLSLAQYVFGETCLSFPLPLPMHRILSLSLSFSPALPVSSPLLSMWCISLTSLYGSGTSELAVAPKYCLLMQIQSQLYVPFAWRSLVFSSWRWFVSLGLL